MTSSLPNILCLVSEDCPPRLGAYGDTLAHTPNLDELAKGGVTWDVACCTSPVCAPSRFAILTGRHAESVPPIQHMATIGHLPEEIVTYPEVLRAAGYYCTNNFKTHYNCDVDPHAIWDETSPVAHWRNRPNGVPFLAVFNCLDTHESCVFVDQAGSVRPEDVDLPAYLPDTEGTRTTLARYYNAIESMDRFMGERLQELEDDGLAEDTIVIYYSDHASPLPRSKRFCYDDGLRVPLIARVPERWHQLSPADAGSSLPGPVSLVDIFPTLLELAGCPAPQGLPGKPFLGIARSERVYAFSARDRMDEHYDMTRTARSARYRYIRNYAPHRIYGQHYAFAWNSLAYQDYETEYLAGRLDPDQRSFWESKRAEELYDTQNDRDQLRNLIDSPQHREILTAMRSALDEHMIAIHDCGFIPESSGVEGWQQSRDPDLYPIREVIHLAGLAIQRDPALLPTFMDALSHRSPVLRYWAAQGLLILAVEGHPLPERVAEFLAREPDDHVRIPLLEAQGHALLPEESVAALTRFISDVPDVRLKLQALEALHYLPLYPNVSLDLMLELKDDDNEYVRGAAAYLALKLEGTYRPDSQVFRFDLFTPTGHTGSSGTPSKT